MTDTVEIPFKGTIDIDDIYNCSYCRQRLSETRQELPNGEVVDELVCVNQYCPLFQVPKFKTN